MIKLNKTNKIEELESEYEKNAEQFCIENNVKIYAEFLGYEINKNWNDNYSRPKFKIRIKRNKKTWTFDFWNSIAEGENSPSCYDILACLTKYEVGSFENFCLDFGYEEFDDFGYINKQSQKIYKAVCKEFENVNRLFGDCLEDLQEIY